jgi:hypothetical protein
MSSASANLATVKAAQKEVDEYVKASGDVLDAYNALKSAEKKGTQAKELFLVNTNETTTMAYTDSLKVISDAKRKYDIAFAALSKEQQEAITATGKIDAIFGDLNNQINGAKERCKDAADAYDTALKEAKLGDLDATKSAADKKSLWNTVAIQSKYVMECDGELARIKAEALSATITQAVMDAGLAVYASDPSQRVNDTGALMSEIERADAVYADALKAKIEADAAFAEATKTVYKPLANDNSAEIAKLNTEIAKSKKDADEAVAKAKKDADEAVAKAKADADAAVAKAKKDADVAIAENRKRADAAIAAAQANNVPAPAPPAPNLWDLIMKSIIGLISPK